LLPASLLEAYSLSLVYVIAFFSNVYFYLTSGYFSTVSDEKPLLHTWSLAIEEQYYLFFPAMITALWLLGRRHLLYVISLLTLVSLLFSEFLFQTGRTEASFYLVFGRAWELGIGAIIAFYTLSKPNYSLHYRLNELGGLIGLALVFYAIFFFNKSTPFPSVYALIPVIGSALIIVFSNSSTYVGRILCSKTLVSIGLVSYSLYLWHQPIFAFLRIKSIGEPQRLHFALAIAATIVLAILSYYFVEKPFRKKAAISRATVFWLSAVTTSVFLIAGLTGHKQRGFEGRFVHNTYSETITPSPKRKECHLKLLDYLSPDQACRYFGKDISWAVFGDSHTVELAYSLAKKLEKNGIGLVQLSGSGCTASLFYEIKRPGCSEWFEESFTYLENEDSIENVLVAFRYTSFLYGDQLDAYPESPNKDPIESFRSPTLQSAQARRDIYWKSFIEVINRLTSSGKTVYVVYPIPELPVSITKAITPLSIFSHEPMLDLAKTVSSEYYFARNRNAIHRLDSMTYGASLYAIKPFDILCDSKYCPAVRNGEALYFDDNHLSVSGADQVISGSVLENIL
jgi:peptidoglycan/LPS O-acetylase OafA/YrhL